VIKDVLKNVPRTILEIPRPPRIQFVHNVTLFVKCVPLLQSLPAKPVELLISLKDNNALILHQIIVQAKLVEMDSTQIHFMDNVLPVQMSVRNVPAQLLKNVVNAVLISIYLELLV
jgi:hypothetical protein